MRLLLLSVLNRSETLESEQKRERRLTLFQCSFEYAFLNNYFGNFGQLCA